MPLIQKPSAIGLMLCDHVLVEHVTMKPSLIGIFTTLSVEGFPTGPCRFDVYVGLTDGLGTGILDLIVTHLDTMEEIDAHSAELTFPDPLQVVNFRFRFRQIRFPAPGLYSCSLQADGEQLAQRTIKVVSVEDLS